MSNSAFSGSIVESSDNLPYTNNIKDTLKKFGEVDVVYSANTLSHIKNLNEVFNAINIILSEKGILILEDPSLIECLKRNTYDQFYWYVEENPGDFNLLGKEDVKHGLLDALLILHHHLVLLLF